MKIDDQEFSEKLRLHASSLDLDQIAPVGDWSFGQSVRRAKEKSFFFDLSSSHFYPLGLNHPLILKAPNFDNQPQSFNPNLCKELPNLAECKWTVVNESSLFKFAQSHSVTTLSDFTLTSIWGKSEIETTKFESLALRIPDGFYFLCSKLSLPLADSTDHHGWIKLFFSTEIMGPHGRLSQLQKLISQHSVFSTLSGLCFHVMIPQNELNHVGIKADYIDEFTSKFCFPVSVLKSDIEKIAEISKKLKRSHAHS